MIPARPVGVIPRQQDANVDVAFPMRAALGVAAEEIGCQHRLRRLLERTREVARQLVKTGNHAKTLPSARADGQRQKHRVIADTTHRGSCRAAVVLSR